MNLNRYLKQTAKNVISTSRPKVLFAGLIYLVFVFIVSELSGRLLGLNVTAASLEQYFNYIYENNIEYALTLAKRMMPGAAAECIMLLLRFSQQIVFTGLIIFLMNSVRGTGASYGNLLDGFGYIIKLFFLSLVQTIFIALWSLLLVVPGIIAAYRYSMATYILLDNPKMSVMQCLKTSKQMMKGHKAELFRVDLSFFVWHLFSFLCSNFVPLMWYFAAIWFVPYYHTAIIVYYDSLMGKFYNAEPNAAI